MSSLHWSLIQQILEMIDIINDSVVTCFMWNIFFCARHTGSNILQLRPALLVRLNRENPTLPFLQKNNMISHLKPFTWYTPTPTMDKEYLLTDFPFLNTRNLNNDTSSVKDRQVPLFQTQTQTHTQCNWQGKRCGSQFFHLSGNVF